MERPLSWRQWLLLGVVAGGVVGLSIWSPAKVISLKEIQIHSLLQKASHGSQQELAKLLLVTERYRDSGLRVIFDGNEYGIGTILTKAREYLATHYHDEPAETWVRVHLYRSSTRGEIIYMQYPDGTRRPLRDVFIEELRQLPHK